jgi:hypothetical protein
MIELAFLVIWNRLMNWGLEPIIATRTVAADGGILRGFLSNPANQWRLAHGLADVRTLQSTDERCDARLRLPFGARLHASLSVRSRTARVLTAELQVGRRTVAWATWILAPGRGTTNVDLAVQPGSRSLATRLFLLLGGRRWIAWHLDLALAALATTAARALEHGVTSSATDVAPTPARTGSKVAAQVGTAVGR